MVSQPELRQMIKNKPNNSVNNYLKYSSLGFEMLIIILVGVGAGYKLDEFLALGFPAFTLIFTILAIVLAIYKAIKDFI